MDRPSGGMGPSGAAVAARNSLWNALRVGSSSLTLVAVPIYLASQMEPRTFAAWSAIFALASVFLVFDFGLPTAVQFAATRARVADTAGAVGAAALAISAGFVGAAFLGSVLMAPFLEALYSGLPPAFENEAGIASVLLISGMATTTATNVISAYYVGLHQSKVPAIIVTPSRISAFCAVAVAALLTHDLVALAAAFVAPIVIGFVALAGWYAVINWRDLRPRLTTVFDIGRSAAPLAVWSLAMAAVTSTGAIAVGRWDYDELPMYSVASAMWAAQAGLQTALMASFATEYGRLVRREGAESRAFLVAFFRLNSAVLVVGLTGALLCVAGAGILGLQAPYGVDQTLLVTALVLAGTTFRLSSYPISVAVIAVRRQGSLIPLVLTDAVVTTALVLAITRAYGVIGCAVATLVSGVLSLSFAFALTSRLSGVRLFRMRVIARACAGATATVAALVLALELARKDAVQLLIIALLLIAAAMSARAAYAACSRASEPIRTESP